MTKHSTAYAQVRLPVLCFRLVMALRPDLQYPAGVGRAALESSPRPIGGMTERWWTNCSRPPGLSGRLRWEWLTGGFLHRSFTLSWAFSPMRRDFMLALYRTP